MVKPTGVKPPARTDTAEGIGIPPPAIKWPTEGIYVLLVNSRAEWSKRCVWGWPEMTPVSS